MQINTKQKESVKPSRNVHSGKPELRHHQLSFLPQTSLVLSATGSLELSLVSSAILEHTNNNTLHSNDRRSEIHALAMDANHLRFNQSDCSVSMIIQTGFLAKNQLPSISPDPKVIPSLARTCKREQSERLLCPIRALKFYLKMTSLYCQNRTRLFLPIKGNQDISKASVSRRVSYTIKLGYRELTNRDISFLKIKSSQS